MQRPYCWGSSYNQQSTHPSVTTIAVSGSSRETNTTFNCHCLQTLFVYCDWMKSYVVTAVPWRITRDLKLALFTFYGKITSKKRKQKKKVQTNNLVVWAHCTTLRRTCWYCTGISIMKSTEAEVATKTLGSITTIIKLRRTMCSCWCNQHTVHKNVSLH